MKTPITPILIAMLLCVPATVAAVGRNVSSTERPQAAEDTKERAVRLKPYGFVRNYICYDSRRCYSTMGEMFNIMPMDEAWNEDHTQDLNAVHELTFVSFTSRAGIDITGPRIWNAASSGKIEADFCGFGSNNTMLRIRQAYVRLAWKRVTVTCGQTWHPMSIQVMPSVSGLASGSPFSPFNRSPQLNAGIDLGHGWDATAAALYQFPNVSTGPDGTSYQYSRWSGYPEIYVGVKHVGRHFTVGAGADILSIMPRRSGTVLREIAGEDGTVTAEEVTAVGTHPSMVSGFGATAYDPETGAYEYAPIRSFTTWINATYGTRCRVGIMGGFTQNLGAARNFISTDDFWMRGAKNVDYIYRISPSLTYAVKNLTLALETDYTVVGYGDVAINGRSKALRNVGNVRVCTMIKYSF